MANIAHVLQNGLTRFVPEGFAESLAEMVVDLPLNVRVVRPRKTKLGDFRPNLTGGSSLMTINGDLKPWQFLITFVHEVAHCTTFVKYGIEVKPHGIEWKTEFQRLMVPFFADQKIPKSLERALAGYLVSGAATSCTDVNLTKAINELDGHDALYLMDLKEGERFVFHNRTFIKGEVRRSRIKCLDCQNGKFYTINNLAEVERVEP